MEKQTQEEKLRQILHNLDWFKIMQKAIDSRKTSWNFQGYGHPIIEWRNATDEVCMAVINALEDKGVLENMYIKVNRIMEKAKQKGGLNSSKD